MHQLTGKYVNVVLSVECGRGMDFLKNTVHITGNFNNRILESDEIPAEDCPPFNTELVWEIEKKELRKIRSANLPLRVECITVDAHNRRERVGFALLSLRSAQIISRKNVDQQVSSQWHRLIGCQRDKKKKHPELYVSLTLRDHSLNDLDASVSNEKIPYISEEDNIFSGESSSFNFPIKYFEDGHIQVGDETAQTSFTFNLLVKKVANLDALLPEVLVFQKTDLNYYLVFKILGVSIRTKSFSKELHNDILLNEKIVVNILSTRAILESFFESHHTSIIFCRGPDILGVTNIEAEDVFAMTDNKSFFKFPSANGMVPFGGTEQSPFIELLHWIEENDSGDAPEEDVQETFRAKTIYSSVSQRSSNQVVAEDVPGEGVNSNEEELILCEKQDNSTTKSIETFIRSDTLSPRLPGTMSIYQKFTFQITLNYIIWKDVVGNGKIIFKFLHPRAASCTSILTELTNAIDRKITLHDLNVKVSYLSTPDKVEKQLKFWQPKLVLTDDREVLLCREHNLDINCLDKQRQDFEICLLSCQNAEPIAKVGVSVTLKLFYTSESEDYEHLHLLPIITDEFIMIKEISDLEKWKLSEKERFENELDFIKTRELEELKKEWDEKKVNLEKQVAAIVNKCKHLQEELRNKMNSLNVDRALKRNANNTQIYEEVFKENWRNFSTDNTKEMIELLSRTQRDNQLLKEMCDEQRRKLKQLEDTSLTKTQTMNILEELTLLEHKFEEVQNAKSYFKEQWKKACEEIHSLKTEDLKSLQVQIKKSKEELSQLSLDEYCERSKIDDDDNEKGGYFYL